MISVLVLAPVVLGAALLRRALHRRREGWYARDGDVPATDARGAVNRASWMLGGSGTGG